MAFRETTVFEALVRQREHFDCLHKLDQDRILYDVLRSIAVQNGFLSAEGIARNDRVVLNHTFLGHSICPGAWRSPFGIGNGRYNRIPGAVLDGQLAPPVDLRYLKDGRAGVVSTVRSQIRTYLDMLYETMAEVLPEDAEDLPLDAPLDVRRVPTVDGPDPWESLVWGTVENPTSHIVATSPEKKTLRYLEPGSIFNLWKEFMMTEGVTCGWRVFWEVWKKEFRARN